MNRLNKKNTLIQLRQSYLSFSVVAKVSIVSTLLSVAALPALAQSVIPSPAEELLRQQERERVLRSSQERTPDVRVLQPAIPQALERLPSDESACADIKTITLVGDAAEQFQWAVRHANLLADGVIDSATNRCLGSRGVNLVMRRIQNGPP